MMIFYTVFSKVLFQRLPFKLVVGAEDMESYLKTHCRLHQSLDPQFKFFIKIPTVQHLFNISSVNPCTHVNPCTLDPDATITSVRLYKKCIALKVNVHSLVILNNSCLCGQLNICNRVLRYFEISNLCPSFVASLWRNQEAVAEKAVHIFGRTLYGLCVLWMS